jgi:hypothetical protein
MSVTFPEAVKSFGKKKVLILTSEPADETAITTTEIGTAITAGLEATMYFVGNFAPAGSQNKGSGPRRTGEGSQLQRLGLATYESPTLTYVHDPQGGPTDVANKVKTALAPGTEVWIVERAGVDSETAFAADDQYRVHHVEVGEQFFAPSGDGEFDYEVVTQETGYLTKPVPGTVETP